MSLKEASLFLGRLLSFSWRVLVAFMRNRGILLAGGVGYNALLSAIPFLALTVTGLSFVFDEHKILATISSELRLLVPNQAEAITQAIESFLKSRDVLGVVGFAVLIFFSSIAFRMLEEAIAVIFRKPARRLRRRIWVSVLLPYGFIGVLGLALLLVTVVRGFLSALEEQNIQLMGLSLSMAGTSHLALRFTSFLSLVLLFTAIYKVLPVVRISLRSALIGGLSAAAMWEMVGQGLVYYFANISLVPVVYGSLTTVIVILLSMEAAAIILLLGAQVIAELRESAAAGVPWYVKPPADV